jgi:hypothetical protein
MGKVFYIFCTATVIDYAREGPDGRFYSYWQGQTLGQLAEIYPGVILCDESDFLEAQSRALPSKPKVISEREFNKTQASMPAPHWTHSESGTSSKSREFYGGTITLIFERAESCCWKFVGDAGLSHQQSVEVVLCAQG